MDIFRQEKKEQLRRRANWFLLFLMALYYSLFLVLVFLFVFWQISLLEFIGLYISSAFFLGIWRWKVGEMKKRYGRNREVGIGRFLWSYTKSRIAQLFITIWLLFIWLWYFNDVSPYSVNQYTIFNPKTGQTLVFQEMIHIGGRNFYRRVSHDIGQKAKEWYVLYYEEVLPQESDWEETAYKEYLTALLLEKIAEVRDWGWNSSQIMKQRNEDLLFNAKFAVRADISNERIKSKEQHVGIDYKKYDIEEIKNEALIFLFFKNARKQKELSDEIKQKIQSGSFDNEGINVFRRVLEYSISADKQFDIWVNSFDLDELVERNDLLFEEINKWGVQSLIIKGYINAFFSLNSVLSKNNISLNALVCELINTGICEDFQTQVIDLRDSVLAEYVLSRNDEKIFITYWKAHFEWFWSELNKRSLEKWEGEFIIVNTENIKVF